jgi:hypothetical protein
LLSGDSLEQSFPFQADRFAQQTLRDMTREAIMKRILAVLTVVLLGCSISQGREKESYSGKFNHAEYMQATAAGQKKAAPAVKGSLCFDTEKKTVDFLDQNGAAAFSIRYGAIRTILYEKTSKPRYAEAILISPLFIFSHSKNHFLTIQYADDSGAGQFVIVHLDKKNVREAVAVAEAQTGKKVEQVEEK